ncbi:MAG: hypothetical protein P4L82_13670 [Ancalomicrobiaceae bacterium]|nr:hypothetical protein [Ancalomicrobiaceae bacterium]
MDPKRAIEIAREYVKDVYSGEAITNIGLEEVEYLPADDVWRIGISFSRERQIPRTRAQVIADMMADENSVHRNKLTEGPASPIDRKTIFEQVYKSLSISDSDGQVLSMKNMAHPDMVA